MADIRQFTTLKARLYPNEAQAELFEKTFGCCRYIWNRMLADQQRFYLETDTHFIPTPAKYKKEAPFLTEVDNQALIQEHNKLSQAFRVFFKKPECFGYPNFKRKKHDRDSFTACNHEFASGPTIYIIKDGLRMTKAGIIKAKFPRRPRNGWKLKRVTVDRTRSGKYYAYILYEYAVKEPEPVVPAPETTVGLKYSMRHFYAADNGELADPPQWLRQSQEKLANIQRRLSRMQPGSKNYQGMVHKYRLLHEHIANQRRDFIHKESRRIANAWDAVCVRGDDLAELSRNPNRGSAAMDGYGAFRECLRYKLERQGKALIAVDRYAPTSRTCSGCGMVLDSAVSYKRRLWTCPKCGAVHDREVNAAKNIKAEGLAQYQRTRKRKAA
ncbi:RNA-guided endonuclease TnpB family protein [uncultured Oscillibacter sp.]|uniref:RNA-guided endonuclease InsQ/TnpB family protein n=1 Tax=uncultured Oscillibacter sp. TaxID=876091 RepID=UPI002618B05C|nr:RNA-guided endonuclease TnpB family protein [uncultured Oscillibacter sp.]